MGGDNAPDAVIKGAIRASKEIEADIILIGIEEIINSKIKSSKIIIDTVARVQGLTTDICIYIVPNTHYLRTLEPRLFNVATGRAKKQTIIIADKEILEYYRMDKVVRGYLEKLDREFSFYLPYNKEKKLITNNNLNLIEE